MSTQILRPNANGDTSGWSILSGADAYAMVDEASSDGDTTYIYVAYLTGLTTNLYLRLGSTNNDGANLTITTSYAEFSSLISRPGGGSWTEADLADLKVGIYSSTGGGTRTDVNLEAWPHSGQTINSVTAYGTIKYIAGKSGSYRCTQLWVVVDYGSAEHPAPTYPEADRQTNPTLASEHPIFTAIFNATGGSGTATQAKIQLNDTDVWTSPKWDSGWLDIDDTPHGQRSSPVKYAGTVMSSATTYYWRIRFRDDSLVQSNWSASQTVAGFVREIPTALAGYRARKKIYWDTPHVQIDAGYTQRFNVRTGLRKIVATNGYFNEAVQASGGFSVVYHNGRTHFVYLANFGDSGFAEIWINTLDHQTGLWGTPRKVCNTATSWDTHYFPVIEVDGAGYLHVAISGHYGGLKYIRSKYSNVSGALPSDPTGEELWIRPDTGAPGPMSIPNTESETYPILFYVPTLGRLFLLYRWGQSSSAWKYLLHYSDNAGVSWSAPYTILFDQTYWNSSNGAYRLYMYGVRYDTKRHRLHISWTHNHLIGGVADVERGIWYAYSDLGETVLGSSNIGFNVWHWADGTIAGYTTPNDIGSPPPVVAPPWMGDEGDPIDWIPSKAIRLSYITDPVQTYGADTLGKLFTETLELTADGEPIVFWEQKQYKGSPTNETNLCCARWLPSVGGAGAWTTVYVTDQVNLPLRVRRSSIAIQCDRNGIIRALMPVNGKTFVGLVPTSDFESSGATSSEATIYGAVNDGLTNCDGDSSYVDVSVGGKFACGHSGLASLPFSLSQARLLDVRIEVFARTTTSNWSFGQLYLDDGTTEDAKQLSSFTPQGGWTLQELTWDTNPFTSTAWAWADIDGLKFGVRGIQTETLRVSRLVLRLRYTFASDDKQFATELWELSSLDGGLTWKAHESTRNSGIGVPILNHKHHLTNDAVEFIWTSGHDLFYLTDRPWGYMQKTGIDFRLVYADAEIDRILDYPDLDETAVIFKVQETIPANAKAGPDDYYIYYDNPNETTRPKADPAQVYVHFENWESYAEGAALPLGDWTAETGSGAVYSSPPSHANKVFSGEKSLQVPYGGKTLNSLLTLTSHRIDAGVWQESAGGDDKPRLEIEDASGNKFAIGYNNASNYAGFLSKTVWQDDDIIRADQQHFYRLRLQIVAGEISGWFEDRLVCLEVMDIMTTATKLRLCSPANCFWDYIRVSKAISVATKVEHSGINEAYDDDINDTLGTDSDTLEYGIDAYGTTISNQIRKLRFQVQLTDDETQDPLGDVIVRVRVYSGHDNWAPASKVAQRDITISVNGQGTYYGVVGIYALTPGYYSFKVDFVSGYTGSYVLRLYKWWETITDPVEPTVTVQAEEMRGFRIDAVIRGKGGDAFHVDAVIGRYRFGQAVGLRVEQKLAGSPASILAVERRQIPSTESRLQIETTGPAQSAPVFSIESLEVGSVTGVGPAEITGIGSAAEQYPVEFLVLPRPLGSGPVDNLGKSEPVATGLVENLAGQQAVGPIPVESYRVSDHAALLRVEAGLLGSAEGRIAIEQLSGTPMTILIPVGVLVRAGLEGRLPIEWKGAAVVDIVGLIPVEYTAKGDLTTGLPISLVSGLGIPVAWPVEASAQGSAARSIPIENRLVSSIPGWVPIEYLAAGVSQSALPVDIILSPGFPVSLPLDVFQQSSASRQAPIESQIWPSASFRFLTESLSGAVLQYAAPVELIRRIGLDGILPIEWGGAALVEITGRIPVELLSRGDQGAIALVDLISKLSTSGGWPSESSIQGSAQRAFQVENRLGVSPSARIPVDYLVVGGSQRAMPVESLLRSGLGGVFPLEWAGAAGLEILGHLPVEGLLAGQSAASKPVDRTQWTAMTGRGTVESLLASGQTGLFPIEWQGVEEIAMTGRFPTESIGIIGVDGPLRSELIRLTGMAGLSPVESLRGSGPGIGFAAEHLLSGAGLRGMPVGNRIVTGIAGTLLIDLRQIGTLALALMSQETLLAGEGGLRATVEHLARLAASGKLPIDWIGAFFAGLRLTRLRLTIPLLLYPTLTTPSVKNMHLTAAEVIALNLTTADLIRRTLTVPIIRNPMVNGE